MAQAEGWVIKAKLVRSVKYNALNGDDFTQKIYCLLIAAKDSWGMLPADGYSLKAALGPMDGRKPEAFIAAVEKLAAVGLVFLWEHQGSPWLYVCGHDEESPIARRMKKPQVPRPDLHDIYLKVNEVRTKSGLSQDFVSRAPAIKSLSPLKSSLKSSLDPSSSSRARVGTQRGEVQRGTEDFQRFWAAYPKRVGRGAAWRVWECLSPSPELVATILAAIEQQKRGPQWSRNGGQYIPHPRTWLSQERWTDEPEPDVYDDGIPQGHPQNMAVLRRVLARKE